MRRLLPVLGLLFILPFTASAEGASKRSPQAVYIDEGDAIIPFAVTCASLSWTQILSSDTISRSVLYVAVSTNSTTICISTISASGYACTDDTPGMDLVPGASLADYTSISWYCRARQAAGAADTRGKIKGRRSRDRGDYGAVR